MTEWGIDTLFNPGKRHMDEEKRRLQSTREEVGDSSGGRRIDLESGTVVISRKRSDAAASTSDEQEAERQVAVAEDDQAETEDPAETADASAQADGSTDDAV